LEVRLDDYKLNGLRQVRLKTHAQAIPRTSAMKELAAALRRAAKE